MLKAIIFGMDISISSLPKALYNADIKFAVVSSHSPSKDMFKAVLSELGVSANEAVVVEDSDCSIEAAKTAGIACVGYINPDIKNQSLIKADMLIESFDGLSPSFFECILQRFWGLPVNIASTKRLFIRELAVSDIKELYSIYSEPQIRRYIDNIDSDIKNEMEKQKAYIHNVYTFYGYGLWGVFNKADGKLIGRCGIENQVVNGKEEIALSYLISHKCQGHGYALESCNAVFKYAYNELDIKKVVAIIDTDNLRSIKTAQRLGMVCVKEFYHNSHKAFLYSKNLEKM